MYIIALLLLSSICCLIICVKGKLIWDRLLGLSLLSTNITVIIVVFAIFRDEFFLIDISIVYILLGIIGTTFMTIFFRRG